MLSFGQRSNEERSGTYLGLLLLLMIALAGVLAHEAHYASLARSAAAERMLADDVGAAAWAFAVAARAELAQGASPGVAFRRVVDGAPLLPGARGVPPESLLALVVTDAAGRAVFRAGGAAGGRTPPLAARRTFGTFAVTVALRPAATAILAPEAAASSRIPLLLGLLGLTALLMGVAILQLGREQELARLRADFVSGVSHELRTPLAQIRMFAETLKLGWVRSDGERQRALDIIDEEARRLTHLVENVLRFSQAERHAVRLAPERTDLARELREAIASFAPLALARRASVVSDAREGVSARVDREALRQVLLNLLDNAVKYGPEGQTVRVTLERTDGRARIAVEDQGPGIPAAERLRIWKPFTRLERDVNTAVSGSGIGLAVVRELVALHGGTAWVEDRPVGARFVVELPVEKGAA